MIKNLAIKGGGVKGIAYVGALHELEKQNILQGLQRVSGTSAGSLVAAMIAVGLSAADIEKAMRALDFKKFEGGFNPFRIFSMYGLYSGDYILHFIRSFFRHSPYKLHPNVTFKEMRAAGCKDLYVFACNVNSQAVVEFSADKTPDTFVAEAIRASMSIPFFFKAFQFSNSIPNDHIYVDGGVVYNYPLTFFDHSRFYSKGELNDESIGLFLYAKENRPHKQLKNNSPIFFSKQLFESLTEAQDILVSDDDTLISRSIMIDDLHYSATDFNLSGDDMNKLIESGSKAAKEFMSNLNTKN